MDGNARRHFLSVALLVICAVGPSAASETVVVQWNQAILQTIREVKPAPPVTARALAFLHTCMYDAWTAYDPVALGTQNPGLLRRPAFEHTEANKREAISYAAFRALSDLFPQPAQVARYRQVMQSLGYDPDLATTDPTTPAGVGNVCAAAVIEFRHDDGSNQLGLMGSGPYQDYTGYQPVNTPTDIVDPNRWQPLAVPNGQGGFNIQKFAVPFWTNVTPFALTSGSQLRPKPPVKYPNGRYIAQVREILHNSAQLGDREKCIAEYWSDGPSSEQPPGHWCLIAAFVSERDSHTLDQDAQMFFVLTNALMDASISCWDAKVTYDYVRPVTAVHYLYQGKKIKAWAGPYQGIQHIAGEDWKPYQATNFVTPPFAEYVSGHSTFSAASAEVLRRFTGSDAYLASFTMKAGASLIEPGASPTQDVTLQWSTFSQAADEAGLSRRYGGIHFEDADMEGRAMGRSVGALVWDKAQSYINGSAVN